jgi:succinoglycan biosynthesis transport protein ExoP
MNEFLKEGGLDIDQSVDDVIELKEYWFIFCQSLYGILAFTMVISGIAILGIFLMPPVYQSTATILIESSESKMTSFDTVSPSGGIKSIYFATQFEILKSRELAEAVIVKNRKVFREQLQKEKNGDANYFPRGLFGKFTVAPVKGTQLAKITYESSDPKFAAAVANDLAHTYIENNLESRVQVTQQATAWLAEKNDSLREKLLESEQKLQTYRESQELIDVAASRTGKTLSSTEVEVASLKLAEAKQRRIQAENIASQVKQLPNQNIETLATIPAVLQNNLVEHLKEQEAEAEKKLSELMKRYGDKHPKIIAAQSDLDAARQSVADQILKVVEGINNEAKVARATEKDLEEQLAESKKKMQMIKRKEYRLDQLERELVVNRQLYDTFSARLKEASDGGEMITANARIIDHAVAAKKPVRPDRILLSLTAIISSFVLAVLIAFIREAMNSTIRSKDDVRLKLHQQLLGVLPLLRDEKGVADFSLEYTKNVTGSFAESIRTMRTGVVLSGLDNPHKVLVVTSSIPGEGKTTVASNLAAAFGQMEKTILIDADMRRPSIAKNFSIKSSSPGLSNLVAETAELDECIHRIDGLSFAILTAGMLPPNPLELLSSKHFATALQKLEQHYDRIIIDTAPCEVVSDALVLSTLSNAVIYVVKADQTSIRIVKSGLARLREIKAPITGVVLNQVDISKKSMHDGYGRYHGGYYDYYGYSAPAADKK